MSVNFNSNQPAAKFNYHENETEVLLTTKDNQHFRVTVKGSEQLLSDEAKVYEIACGLLALAKVYDVGGKTQSIAIKHTKDTANENQTIIEQTRKQAKKGVAEDSLVTQYKGKNVKEILRERGNKIESKLRDRVDNSRASESSARDPDQKLNDVIEALRYFTRNDVPKPPPEKKVQEVIVQEERQDAVPGDVGVNQSEELKLEETHKPAERTSTSKNTPAQKTSPPLSNSPPPPPPPLQNSLNSAGQAKSQIGPLDQKKDKKLKPEVTSGGANPTALFDQIKNFQGNLKKIATDEELLKEIGSKEPKKNDFEPGSLGAALSRALDVRRVAFEDEDEEDGDKYDPEWDA